MAGATPFTTTAQIGDTAHWSSLITNRKGPDDPRLPPHKIGDVVPVKLFAGDSGPIPLIKVTEDLGADWRDDFPDLADYWKFAGVVVGHVEAEPKVTGYSDQLEHHLNRLSSGD